MQAPIRFTSAIPGAIAQRQGDQQALQQFFDRNKVEKARMEQIKSLKQLAKGYGASAAQVESSSYGELQGFVQRMELERADKTREEQARLRELQMAQARQAMMFAAERAGFASEQARFAREDREREKEERQRADILARFMTSKPDPIVQPPIDAEKNILPQYRINVETPQPAPMELGPSDRFRRIASDPNLDPRSKMEAMNRAKTEELMLAKLAAEQGSAALATQIKVNAELRDQTGFTRGERILAFTPDRHSLKIDGGSALAISGAIDHEATAVQIKDEALPSFNKGMAAFNRLMEYADQRERENWMSSEDKTAAEALANELRGLLREDILGPGTVQESERAIIAEVLPNPTKYWSFTSGAEGKKRLLELRNSIANKFKERLRGLGLEVEGMTNPGNTRQLSTGKEVEILFDPAE